MVANAPCNNNNTITITNVSSSSSIIVELSKDNHLISQHPSRVCALIRSRCVCKSRAEQLKRKSLNERKAMNDVWKCGEEHTTKMLINAFTCVKLQKPATEWKSDVFEFKIKRFYRNLLFAMSPCVCAPVDVWVEVRYRVAHSMEPSIPHKSIRTPEKYTMKIRNVWSTHTHIPHKCSASCLNP